MKPELVTYPVGDAPPTASLFYGADVRDALRALPEKSVQVVCTSPPYWALRDYGLDPTTWGGNPKCRHDWTDTSVVRKGSTNGREDMGSTLVSAGAPKTLAPGESNDPAGTAQRRTDRSVTCRKCGAWRGQLGQEPTPALYVAHLVEVFREVRRVLRDDGVVWLNLGDTYAANRGKPSPDWPEMTVPEGLKQKDLVGIPWRAAFALQEDGWWLRADAIWSKVNGIPDGATDRPTRTHEYVFLLTKAANYFYDADAVREPAADYDRKGGAAPCLAGGSATHGVGSKSFHQMNPNGRNRRSVWEIPTSAFEGAHFATWPPELVRLMIKAGSSEKGSCPKCGAPWRRVVEKGEPDMDRRTACGSDKNGEYEGKGKVDKTGSAHPPTDLKRNILKNMRKVVGVEWEPTCKCGAPGTVRCVVLDPFCGSGTTGRVAFQENRDFVGIDLNGEYLKLAKAWLLDERPPCDGRDGRDSVLDLF